MTDQDYVAMGAMDMTMHPPNTIINTYLGTEPFLLFTFKIDLETQTIHPELTTGGGVDSPASVREVIGLLQEYLKELPDGEEDPEDSTDG